MHLDVPRHLVMFTRTTLSVAFARAGFDRVEVVDRIASLGMERATSELLRRGISARPRVGPLQSLRAAGWWIAHRDPGAEGSELIARATPRAPA
jgi:hypothetical protein